jgi:hypothetical protein
MSRSHSKGGVEEIGSFGRTYRVPLDAPPVIGRTPGGKPRMPEAIRAMTLVIRERQNSVADYYELENVYYDWNKMRWKWYPGSGTYNPKEYKKTNPDGKNRT